MEGLTLRLRRGRALTVVAGFLALALATGFIVAKLGWAAEPQPQPGKNHLAAKNTVSDQQVAARTAPLADIEQAFMAISDRMQPSVVTIRVDKTVKAASNMPDVQDLFRGFGGPDGFQGGQGRMFRQMPQQYHMSGAGSGVIVRDDGWIMTNDHVVGGADKVIVKLNDGREFPGTVRRDFRSDIALVKIEASSLVAAELGDSDRVRVGQWAIAFGSPFNLDSTMTAGIISARSRSQTIGSSRDEQRSYSNLLQTDAAINPGNSGGALVDIRGHVIGINVAIESPSGGSVGIGFAIPVNTAKDIMDQLITHGKVTRAYLGVAPRPLTYPEKQKLGLTAGAMVQTVSDGTPAAKAGFQPGDVITKVQGKTVADDAALRDHIAHLAPGSRADFTVQRDGKQMTLTATVESAPDMLAGAGAQDAPERAAAGGKLGIGVEEINADSARRYNLSGSASGLVVVEVQPGSPAEHAGIQAGDVVLKANGRNLKAPGDLSAATAGLRSGDTADLVILRAKSRSLVTVTIP